MGVKIDSCLTRRCTCIRDSYASKDTKYRSNPAAVVRLIEIKRHIYLSLLYTYLCDLLIRSSSPLLFIYTKLPSPSFSHTQVFVRYKDTYLSWSMFIYFNWLLQVTLHFEIMNSLLFLIIEAIIADDKDIKNWN